MRMHKAFGITSLLAAVLVIAPTRSQAAHATGANDLLNAIWGDAAQVASETDHMASVPDWGLQVLHISDAKDAINDIKAKLDRLSKMLPSLDTVQQHEYYRAILYGSRMAADTTQAINFLNENPDLVWTGDYRDITVRLYTDASELSHTLQAYSALDKVQQHERKLQTDLGVPAE